MKKLLIIYDVHHDRPDGVRVGWAYYRRATAIKKYAPKDWSVDIRPIGSLTRAGWRVCAQYNIVFNMEYGGPAGPRKRESFPDVPLVLSYNSDSKRRAEYFKHARRQADWLVINNLEMFDHCGRLDRTCNISNGVDREIFCPTIPLAERAERVFWCGSSNPKKRKGWNDVLEPSIPLLEKYGFIPEFRPIDEIDDSILSATEMAELYNECKYVVCVSETEGTPNYFTEAVSCGCVPVTTFVGNVREWHDDGRNAIMVDQRSPINLIASLLMAREFGAKVASRSEAVMRWWHYGGLDGRARYYYALFDAILERGINGVNPFTYVEVEPEDI